MKKIRVKLNGNIYSVAWDECSTLDAITREKDGKALTIKNKDALRIYNNEAKLFRGILPDGFEKV